jgi:hypothetical protein
MVLLYILLYHILGLPLANNLNFSLRYYTLILILMWVTSWVVRVNDNVLMFYAILFQYNNYSSSDPDALSSISIRFSLISSIKDGKLTSVIKSKGSHFFLSSLQIHFTKTMPL